MSVITKLARFGAVLLFPLLGCMADANDAATDDVDLGEQGEALLCPPPPRWPYLADTQSFRPGCDPCALVRCSAGTHCEAKPIYCFRAPCTQPPGQCVPDEPLPEPDAPACGGLATRPCPGLGECVENPYDNCDPNDSKNPGADCGGLCVCEANANCAPGFLWDGSADVCNCVAVY
jgi:hypothetical protein